ncbi:MAG: tRNA (guanosine(37)-N1)-methyltransferase TrmD [Thermoanaerobaculales bacterium]|nr:tRNA (guanosine(37)-N1)-methyltransferase TrmD [Thermoanaerobaculales bacterium]
MHFDVLTLFPGLFDRFKIEGVLGRAVEAGILEVDVYDLRRWAGNRWGQIDDEPYGGGAGMVIQAPPVLEAVREILPMSPQPARVVLLSPRGRPLNQDLAEELRDLGRVLMLCGRYEGFDERVVEILDPLEISLGDFVLGGGEVAAMAVIEAVSRLVPGVVGDPLSVAEDSFSVGLLDYPCYTRPAEVEGRIVPNILLSGHHAKIRRWRIERAVEATVTRRPDLVKKYWNKYPDEVRRLIRRYAPDLAEIVERAEAEKNRGRK